jgi:uroporphyrinogen decarboxylase
MNAKADRIRATLEGRRPDRPAYSYWTHFPAIDLDPSAIAAATIEFARALDLDFVKAMPNGLYCVEDWGVVPDFSAIAGGGAAKVLRAAVERPEDWRRIRRLDPKAGALGRELDHLRRLVAALGRDVPVIATTFSPLTIAKKLGENVLHEHVEAHPQTVLDALSEIAATVAAFSEAAIELGCAGVFFAVQDATSALGAARYRRFGAPFDALALAGASAGWFNVLHMHGDDVLFDLLAAYPVAALNWHVGETEPSIAGYRAGGGDKAVVGGLRRMAITRADRAALAADLNAALAARGVIVAPGCVIRHPVDRTLLGAIAADIKGVRPREVR